MSDSLQIETLSSEDLVLHARAGSDACFGELVRRHGGALKRFLCRGGASEHDAEDLAQEAFLRVHRNLHRFDVRFRFSTWLFTIARNLAARPGKVDLPVDVLPEQVDGRDAAGMLADVEWRGNLWNKIGGLLSEAQVEALWLMYGEGLSVREIAGRTGRSGIYVRVILHRARRKLAAELKDEVSS